MADTPKCERCGREESEHSPFDSRCPGFRSIFHREPPTPEPAPDVWTVDDDDVLRRNGQIVCQVYLSPAEAASLRAALARPRSTTETGCATCGSDMCPSGWDCPRVVAALARPAEPRDEYLILDTRHTSDGMLWWWGPDRCGYTPYVERAGRYTREFAERQARSRATDVPYPLANVLLHAVSIVPTTATAKLAAEPPPTGPTDPRPCPFCGSQPTVELWHGGGPDKRSISCEGEKCAVRPMVTGETLDEAVARWNQREAV